jgi:hypothetical protein
MNGVVFLNSKKHWVYSTKTHYGFFHRDLGTVTTFPTRELAEERALELHVAEPATV